MSEILEQLDFDYKIFIDRTTVLYGETGTGKSTIIIDILKQLNPYVEQIVVISPMEMSNPTFSNNIVPKSLVHYELTERLLENIWDRQKMFAAVYTRANNMETLESLFNKLKLSHVQNVISKLKQTEQDTITQINEQNVDDKIVASKKCEDVKDKFKDLLRMIYKKYIGENEIELSKLNLDRNEKWAIKFLRFNPRLVLVLDDCAASIGPLKNNAIMKKLFYTGRWSYITIIIACQNDKDFPSEIRKNAFVNIFTTDTCAHAYFNRKNNDINKDTIKECDRLCKTTFTGHQKIAYIRSERKFYKVLANKHDKFKFGSTILNEFCKTIESDNMAIDYSNEFSKYFEDV